MTLLNTITPMKFIFSCLVLFLLFSIIQGSSSSSSARSNRSETEKPTIIGTLDNITKTVMDQMKL